MKLTNSWSYRPYAEPNRLQRAALPYICRLAHDEHSFTVDFIDNGAPDAPHTLLWRARAEGEFAAVAAEGGTVTVGGLDTDTDFEFYIQRGGEPEARSQTRLARTGFAPGTVVNYLHPEDPAYEFSGRFLASPSLAKLPSGRLVSSMDVHATATHGENLTLLYYSDDGGESWHYLCELFPCVWGKLFVDGGRLHCLGVSRSYGDLIVGRSDDEGRTWSMPTVLLRGSSVNARGGVHHTPMPMLRHKGRIIFDMQYGTWHQSYFLDGVLSAESGSDLLDVNNWALSEWWDHREHPEITGAFMGGMTGQADKAIKAVGGIEGSPVVAKDGRVLMIHRYGRKQPLILEYDPENPEGALFNGRLTDMPVSDSKAPIQYDEVSDRYWMLCNYALEDPKTARNLCALMSSKDLTDWAPERLFLDHRYEDPKKIGFQYFSFLFDGDDIIFLCRTACSGADTFHNSNHQTFHRIKNFREKP